MKNPVAVIKCSSYNEDNVYYAIKRGIDLLGGINQFCQPGEKILLKPNFLIPEPPEKASTTHPSVFKATALLFQEAGAKLCYGDSPTVWQPLTVARVNGTAKIAESLGIPLADFESGEDIHFFEGKQNQQFRIARGVLNSDGLISLSKMKTHSFTRITGAIKNQFGCIPGILKPEYHLRLKNASQFSRMLVDLNRYLKPRLCIMDGIIAMHGHGPLSGEPYPMHILLISSNPAALDTAFSRIINIDPYSVPAIKWAERFGLGDFQVEEIEIRGESLNPMIRQDFQVPSIDPEGVNSLNSIPWIRNMLSSRPVIDPKNCICCGICVRSCPVIPKAVDFPNNNHRLVPIHNYQRCIRCYCCQENCPQHTIKVEDPLTKRMVLRGYESIQRLFDYIPKLRSGD